MTSFTSKQLIDAGLGHLLENSRPAPQHQAIMDAIAATNKTPKRSKYGAQPTKVDGIRFASKAEARRYEQLKDMRARGEILWFIRQPAFDLPGQLDSERPAQYRADFLVYYADGRVVVEDVKGMRTDVYRLKCALMRQLGIEICEVKP